MFVYLLRHWDKFAQAITSLQSTAAASERVFELFDEPEMEKENQVVELDKDQVKRKYFL